MNHKTGDIKEITFESKSIESAQRSAITKAKKGGLLPDKKHSQQYGHISWMPNKKGFYRNFVFSNISRYYTLCLEEITEYRLVVIQETPIEPSVLFGISFPQHSMDILSKHEFNSHSLTDAKRIATSYLKNNHPELSEDMKMNWDGSLRSCSRTFYQKVFITDEGIRNTLRLFQL